MTKYFFIFLFIVNIFFMPKISNLSAASLTSKQTDLYYALENCYYGSVKCIKIYTELLNLIEVRKDKYQIEDYLDIKYWGADSFYNSGDEKLRRKGIDLWNEIINDSNFDKNEKEITYAYIALGWHHYLDIKDLDDEKAFLYMSIAAKTGSHWALNNLGVFYEEGRIIKKDLKKAFELYSEAAELGNDYAYSNIARFYLLGRAGVEKSFEKALRNYKLSRISEFGDNDFGDLGLLLKYQKNPSNVKEYLMWLEKDLIEKKYPPIFITLAWSVDFNEDNKIIPSKKILMSEYKWFYLCEKFSTISEDTTRCAQEMNILELQNLTKNEVSISVKNAENWIEKNWN